MSKSVLSPPTYQFKNDPDTGMYYTGYDVLSIQNGKILSTAEYRWNEVGTLRTGAEIMAEAKATADAATLIVGIILSFIYLAGLIIWLLR